MQDRRTRTRCLIELGGLVQKSGLPARLAAAEAEDERAVILGVLLTISRMLATPHPAINAADLIARWRAAGQAALRSSAQTNTEPTV
jgi:conjugative transfer protein TraD